MSKHGGARNFKLPDQKLEPVGRDREARQVRDGERRLKAANDELRAELMVEVDRRVAAIDARLDAISVRLDAIERRVVDIEGRRPSAPDDLSTLIG